VGAVNVKATRGEGMGSIGRGEGIAAHAVATVLAVARG
jgi:2C-methyl-D-erythritol 2,4-cyclodiphosphate synthase